MKNQKSKIKNQKYLKIPVEVSARHIHLSRQDKDILFGKNYQFKELKSVSQPNQFASIETLTIKSPKQSIKNVRIIAPVRFQTQVEIAVSDAYTLGVNPPPVLVSGDLKKSVGGIELVGPKGKIKLKKGLIVAQRHLHIEPKLAKKYSLNDGNLVKIEVGGKRSIVFNNVVVRSRFGKDKLSFQLDTDEGNAAGIKKGAKGRLVLNDR